MMACYGSEQIRGHGIPKALEAILIGRNRIGLKVAILKTSSSALSIETGGPFGAEVPIIITGGAFGSLFAQAFNLSTTGRKTLLVAGAAGFARNRWKIPTNLGFFTLNLNHVLAAGPPGLLVLRTGVVISLPSGKALREHLGERGRIEDEPCWLQGAES